MRAVTKVTAGTRLPPTESINEAVSVTPHHSYSDLRIIRRNGAVIGIDPLISAEGNPFQWMSEMIDLKNGNNFLGRGSPSIKPVAHFCWDAFRNPLGLRVFKV
jgi:hypothetical protein